MAAKHILDLQVSVRDLAEAAAAFDVPLARLGYRRRSFNRDHVPAGDSSDPSLLGRRCREARCGAGTAAGRGELPHDVAVNRQRGRQPACDCGRCPLGGRHVLVPDGAGTRKGRNVARDPRCSVAVSVRDADVVIEGDAVRVTEPGAVARIAKAWADNGWPAEPDESGSGITAPFNAPSQGPPPWHVYRIEPRSATVVLATDPGGLTRFRF